MSDRRRIVLERRYPANPVAVWELWTTAAGIERWWGPTGFTVEVHEIDPRPEGTMTYSMRATGADEIEFLEGRGHPLVTTHTVVYREVAPYRLLSFTGMVDFVAGVDPYRTDTSVELAPAGGETKVVVTIDAMHDEEWTRLAVLGWESQLERLRTALGAGEENR